MKVLTIGLIVSGMMFEWVMQPAIAQEICPTARTQLELNECASQSQAAADQDLSKFIATYQTRISDEQSLMLRHTQSTWELFRRFSCEFQSSRVEGGSIYPFIFSLCMAEKARVRLTELQELARCGTTEDLSCPVVTEE
jgi:uncharacterized protein YecT (DUF1311 family)